MQPRTIEARLAVAADFARRFEFTIPLRVDCMSNEAQDAYAAWPERLYVVAADGRIAYKGGRGPLFFDLEDVEEWLQARFFEG